jgi:hypothetical protein
LLLLLQHLCGCGPWVQGEACPLLLCYPYHHHLLLLLLAACSRLLLHLHPYRPNPLLQSCLNH